MQAGPTPKNISALVLPFFTISFVFLYKDKHNQRHSMMQAETRKLSGNTLVLALYITLFGSSILVTAAALAQEADTSLDDDNAVTQAGDAFGFSVGTDSVGLYSASSTRGFSPIRAGNVRLNGLYFDRRGTLPSTLVDTSSIRVGLTAFDEPLPAPSGIADYRTRRLQGSSMKRIRLSRQAFGSPVTEADLRLGQSDGMSLTTAIRHAPDSRQDGGSNYQVLDATLAPTLRWGQSNEAGLFASRREYRDYEEELFYYPAGNTVPPEIRRRQLRQQSWHSNEGVSEVFGGFIDTALGEAWQVRSGLFHSASHRPAAYFEYLTEVTPEGLGIPFARYSPPYSGRSWSGEMQLSRKLIGESLSLRLTFLGRFRSVATRSSAPSFAQLDDNPIPIDDMPPTYSEPDWPDTPTDRDRIQQLGGGVAAQLAWRERIRLNTGLQQADYRKTITFGTGERSSVNSQPLLWNAATAVRLTSSLTAYAGITRGLEESGAAPFTANNANAVLPAALTRQQDAGLQWQPSSNLRMIAGVFRIRRPYAGLDTDNTYRFLGNLENEGVEVSVSINPTPGLTMLIGGLYQQPQRDDKQPLLGHARRQLDLSLDYALGSVTGLSVNSRLNHTDGYRAGRDGQIRLSRTDLDLGARYRLWDGRTRASLNGRVINLLDSFVWNVGSDGGLDHSPPRTWTLALTVDF